MKILLNGLSIVYPISGVGQYTLHLGRGLEGLLGPGRLFCFGRNSLNDSAERVDPKASFLRDQLRYRLKNDLRKIPGLTPAVHVWRDHRFRSYIRRIRPSLYHETKYAPFHFEEGPTVLTIYDLSFVRHPEWHPADRVKHFEKYCLKRLPQVDAIITISEFSKNEILGLTAVKPDKIYVTPLGVDQAFARGNERLPGLPKRYILSLGTLEPRKNLALLIRAFTSLPNHLKERYPLVIAGAWGWNNKELNETLHSLQKKERIILAGYIPQEMLPHLYGRASLFVYPSLYEGFGLPVLEAMACGVPVLASNTSSLPEVIGNAGLLVDPENIDDVNQGMTRLLTDEELRKEFSEKGLKRAAYFSWERCSRETLAVYEKVLGNKG